MTAADHAYRLLSEGATFVVIDIETCPSDEGHRVVSIAAVPVRMGQRRGLWARHVNPGVPITNSHQHHLTDDDVADAPAFAEVAAELDALLAGDDVIAVAHHARFDIGILHNEHARIGLALRDVRILDTMTLPKVVGHDLGRGKSLDVLAASFDLVHVRRHDAASDATVTAQALLALLRVAAGNGYADLDALYTDAGAHRTIGIPPASTDPTTAAPPAAEIPDDHLATHTALLPDDATAEDLDVWVAGAVECARWRCGLLEDKAQLALHHALPLHHRLTKALRQLSTDAEPGQGATLVGALNVLAPAALVNRSVRPWWKNNRATIQALPRCGTLACPSCRSHHPCPIDVAHHAVVEAVCVVDGTIAKKRRREVAGADRCLVTDWSRLGFTDIAGYAAALVADAWLSDGNQPRAVGVVDQAITAGAFDPTLVCMHAQQLASQGNHAAVVQTVTDALEHRTTAPGWAGLAHWYLRYQAATTKRARRPRARPGASVRVARPADRVRPKRFAV
jgi:DNA polymerase III epsilon subunit-like protein